MELRPATPALPFSGAEDPSLCAWARLTDPVDDPYERLLLLADALAPSYGALLTSPVPIPTVRLSVHFTPAVGPTPFDWVLVHASTVDAGADGWITEDIGIWAPDGTHLATASQLRVTRG